MLSRELIGDDSVSSSESSDSVTESQNSSQISVKPKRIDRSLRFGNFLILFKPMFWLVDLKKGRGRYSCLHFRTRTTPSKPRCACRSQSLPIWNILFWPSPTKPLWSWLRSSDTSWRRQDSQPRLCSHLEKHVSNSKCCRDYRCDFNTADKQIRTRIKVQICLRVTKKFASDFDTIERALHYQISG